MIKKVSKARRLNLGWVAIAVVAVVFVVPAVSEAQTYNFVLSWGTNGSGDGELDRPHAVEVDSSGNVYVADTYNSRIQKFDSSGTFLAKWGSSGSGDGQFRVPHGIAADSSGNVYVADNYCIQKFDSSGTFLAKWGQFNFAKGIALDSFGNVYVSEENSNRIQKFDSSGTFLAKWGSSGSSDGQFHRPHGIALDSSGNVYVADEKNHRIQKFDSSGTFLAKWGSLYGGDGDGEFFYPKGIAVDSSGNVYVADTDNNRIQKFDSSGTFLAKWGSLGSGDGEFYVPWGIAVDSSGNVYVADTHNSRIQKFSCENTQPGDDVVVTDEETGTTISFDTVEQGGETTVTLTSIGEGPPPPTGLKLVPLGIYYDIDTTAIFSGTIHIAIDYDDSGLTEGQESVLRLRCYEEATDKWVNITTGLDMLNNIIYGETNHLSFFAITTGILVEIDIKPGSYPNAINLGSQGVIPVAILSSSDFDATTVDPDTVELAGAGVAVRGKTDKYLAHEEDVNGDGLLDLVCKIETENLDPDSLQDGYAVLTGETYNGNGVSIVGKDEITLVPPE